MGLFVKAMHIFADRKENQLSSEEISEKIQKKITTGPYKLVQANEVSDYEVRFGSTQNPSWLVLFDNGEFDLKNWQALSKMLTKQSKLLVMTILVSDSDDLSVNFYSGGVLVEKLKLTVGRRKKVSLGDIWLKLISKSERNALGEQLSHSVDLVDTHLEAIVTAIKLDSNLAFLQFENLDEVPDWPFQSLKFYLPKDTDFLWYVTDPPQFQTRDLEHNSTLPVREKRKIYTDLQNAGRGSRGISIIIPKLREFEGQIKILQIEVCTVHDAKTNDKVFPFNEVLFEDQPALQVDIPDFEFGGESWSKESVKYEPWHDKVHQVALNKHFIWTFIEACLLDERGATFSAIFIPLENPVAGSVHVTYKISKYIP